MTTTINGRTFELTEQPALPNLQADLIKRGFDGNVWLGFSARTGRQRKDLHAMVWRSARTGEYVVAAAF